MAVSLSTVLHRRRRAGRRAKQSGAETVEFAMLAASVFLLLFAIVEITIALYNQGTLAHAAQVGAREASLYWLDVTQILPDSDPASDQRIKTSEVADAISDWAGSYMVSFSGATPVVKLQGQPLASLPSTPVVAPGDRVTVDLSFVYGAPVTKALADLFDLNMAAQSVMHVE